jgi:hypothetical protein
MYDVCNASWLDSLHVCKLIDELLVFFDGFICMVGINV